MRFAHHDTQLQEVDLSSEKITTNTDQSNATSIKSTLKSTILLYEQYFF